MPVLNIHYITGDWTIQIVCKKLTVVARENVPNLTLIKKDTQSENQSSRCKAIEKAKQNAILEDKERIHVTFSRYICGRVSPRRFSMLFSSISSVKPFPLIFRGTFSTALYLSESLLSRLWIHIYICCFCKLKFRMKSLVL